MKKSEAFSLGRPLCGGIAIKLKSEPYVRERLDHFELLVLKIGKNAPVPSRIITTLLPYLDSRAVRDTYPSIIYSRDLESRVNLLAGVMNHICYFKALKTILNDISTPKF
jgi:hypothetical protein